MTAKSNENCGMAVRRDVLNRVYHNPCRMQKLPSAQEYARLFNVSVRSVTLELKKLTQEGLVIGRQGKGTYTNPQGLHPADTANPRLIGLLINGGDNFYYTQQNWHLLAFAGEELTQAGFFVQPIIGGINGRVSLEELLQLGYCDAFLCVEPKEELWPIIEQHTNVFSVEYPHLLDRCVSFSYSAAISQFKKLMERGNRKNLLLLGNPCAAWIKRATTLFQDNGFAADELFTFTHSPEKNNLDELRLFMQKHRIDAVAAYPDDSKLLEAISDSCLPLLLKGGAPGVWNGACFQIPYEDAIRNAIQMLRQSFQGVPPSGRQLNVDFVASAINAQKL